ncbi:MAG: D-aminoacyl-tRNA deacylase [Sulfolobales archaeon]
MGIAYSIGDPAGRGIARRIIDRRRLICGKSLDPRADDVCEDQYIRLVGFLDDVIYLEYLDDFFHQYDAVIVLSRHRASSGIPSLTVHYTGNPSSEALYGGKPRKLAISMPSLGSSLLYTIYREARSSGLGSLFSITYEATHHGPTENRLPIVFVEIGSSEKEWILGEAHEAWARAIDEAIASRIECSSIGIGVGGNHYPSRFTGLTIERRICLGHIIPRYILKGLSYEEVIDIVGQAIKASSEKIETVYIEEKAAQANKLKAIEKIASEFSLKIEYL